MNTADQYVKAIYLLQEMENGPASTGALADMLNVSPASANEMIGKLEGRGLAEHEKYKGVRLTDEGILNAREALQTYCIIERFLANVLDVEEFRAEASRTRTRSSTRWTPRSKNRPTVRATARGRPSPRRSRRSGFTGASPTDSR